MRSDNDDYDDDDEDDDDYDDDDDDVEEMLHCLHVSRHRRGLAVLMHPRLPQSSISSSSLSSSVQILCRS